MAHLRIFYYQYLPDRLRYLAIEGIIIPHHDPLVDTKY